MQAFPSTHPPATQGCNSRQGAHEIQYRKSARTQRRCDEKGKVKQEGSVIPSLYFQEMVSGVGSGVSPEKETCIAKHGKPARKHIANRVAVTVGGDVFDRIATSCRTASMGVISHAAIAARFRRSAFLLWRVFVCPRVLRVHNTRRSMNTDRDMECQSSETPAFQPVGLLSSHTQPTGDKNGLQGLSKRSIKNYSSSSSAIISGS